MLGSRTEHRDQVDPAEALMREVGAQLRQVRREREEDLEQVAQYLRIRASYLAGIEDGDMSVMPGRTYALGFLRSYADYLGFDGDDLVAQIKTTVADLTGRTRLKIRTPLPESRLPKVPILVLSVAALAGVYAGWSYLDRSGELVIDTVAEVPASLRGPETLPTTAPVPDPAVEDPADDQTAVPIPDGGASIAPTPGEMPGGEATAEASDPAASTASSGASSGDGLGNGAPQPAEPVAAAEPRAAVTEAAADPAAAEPADATEAAASRTTAAGPDPGGPARGITGAGQLSGLAPAAGPDPAGSDLEAGAEPAGEPAVALRDDAAAALPAAELALAAPDGRPVATTPVAPGSPSPDQLPGAGVELPDGIAGEAPSPAARGYVAALLEPGVDQDPPQVHEQDNADARVVLRALESSWIQITSPSGDYLRTRTLEAGALMLIPNRRDLLLWTGNAGGLEVIVDGQVRPPLGTDGKVLRDVSLDPERLLAGTAVP